VKCGLLLSVWPDYGWMEPILRAMLGEFWPGHPEIVVSGICGDGRNWTRNLFEGISKAKKKGFDSVYLINEEHVPVGPCHSAYLDTVLPDQAADLGATYVSLFGWDNKRYCSKSPKLNRLQGRWMRLDGKGDPRFHLHPAWWRLNALEACCRVVMEDNNGNGSAWHFEKSCADWRTSIPPDLRDGCYQVCAGATGLKPLGPLQFRGRLAARWVANKAMALLPHIKADLLRSGWVAFWKFDDVISDGPYPTVFSGVLAKGKLNPVFVQHCRKNKNLRGWLRRIQTEAGVS